MRFTSKFPFVQRRSLWQRFRALWISLLSASGVAAGYTLYRQVRQPLAQIGQGSPRSSRRIRRSSSVANARALVQQSQQMLREAQSIVLDALPANASQSDPIRQAFHRVLADTRTLDNAFQDGSLQIEPTRSRTPALSNN